MAYSNTALIFGAIAIVFMSACNAGAPLSTTTKVDYFSDNGLGNSVSLTQHPAGEFKNGITYVTYQGEKEDPYVALYNHETKQWQGPVKAGVSDMGKDPSRKIDNHGKPALIIDDLGYIHIVFGGHGGTKELGENKLGNYHYGRQQHVVSKRPYDISEWENLENISPFGTYNQWIKMDNGDIYLFYRHGAHRSYWVYQKSTDHGRTFGEPVPVLEPKNRVDIKATDAWYGWFGKAANDTIVVAYSYHICWNNTDTRRHTGERHNGYYMQMDTKTGKWTNVEGQVLDMPIGLEQSNQSTLVMDSKGLWSNHGTVQLDQYGYPHVIYAKGPDLGRKHGGPKYPNYYRWAGEQWLVSENGAFPVSVGPLNVESDMQSSLLLSYRNKSKKGEVTYWNTKNGGATFEKGETLINQNNTGYSITSFIRNAHPEAQILVGAKVPNSDLREMYLLGKGGPLSRLSFEVKVAELE